MMKIANIAIAAAALSMAVPALADPVVDALASGAIGEQADGYLGFVSPPSGDLKAAVDALNIKRRAAYTDKATRANATVDQMAQTTACEILGALKPGRAYKLQSGGWRTRQGSESIKPDYCA